MANFIYDLAANSLWKGEIAYDTDAIKAVLIDTALYTAAKTTDQFLSDIPAGARKATSVNLTTKTITARTIDSDDFVFTAVPAGDACEAIVIYVDTGVEATSRLLVYNDTSTGLPVTPNGTDITVQTSSNIAKL